VLLNIHTEGDQSKNIEKNVCESPVSEFSSEQSPILFCMDNWGIAGAKSTSNLVDISFVNSKLHPKYSD
jgi:hypothetical protein